MSMYGSEENKSLKKYLSIFFKYALIFLLVGFIVNHSGRWNLFFKLIFISFNVITEAKVFTFLKISLHVLLDFLLEQCLIL